MGIQQEGGTEKKWEDEGKQVVREAQQPSSTPEANPGKKNHSRDI